jgi:hypothetical protein
MTCPTCGMILKIPGEATEFSCWYCGSVYHPRERTLSSTISHFNLVETEQELSKLKSFKLTKLNELGFCLDEIIRLRSRAGEELLSRRKKLEEEILDINLAIHSKESTLSISRQVTRHGYTME